MIHLDFAGLLQQLLPLLAACLFVGVATVAACAKGKPGVSKQQQPAAAATPTPPPPAPAPVPQALRAPRQLKTKSLEEESVEAWNEKCDKGMVWSAANDDNSGDGLPVPDPGIEARILTDEEVRAAMAANLKPRQDEANKKVSVDKKDETPSPREDPDPFFRCYNEKDDNKPKSDRSPPLEASPKRPKRYDKRDERRDEQRRARAKVTGTNLLNQLQQQDKNTKKEKKENTKKTSTKIDSAVIHPEDSENQRDSEYQTDSNVGKASAKSGRRKRSKNHRSDREDRRDDRRRGKSRRDRDRDDTDSGAEFEKVDSRRESRGRGRKD